MKMTLYTLIMILGVLMILQTPAYAGGAVAKRQNAMKQKQMMMQQKQMMQMQQQKGLQQNQQVRTQAQIQKRAAVIEEVKEVATFSDVLQSLNTSSRAWSLIIDLQAKEAVVKEYIDRFRVQGIVINKSADHYAQMVDAFIETSPDMLSQPFRQVLQVMAIIEYDFNNGANKDDMALKILGSQEAVRQNRQRLGY